MCLKEETKWIIIITISRITDRTIHIPEMETALKNMTVEVDGETLTGWDYFTYRTGFEAIDEFSRLWEQTYTFRIGTSLVDVPITGN